MPVLPKGDLQHESRRLRHEACCAGLSAPLQEADGDESVDGLDGGSPKSSVAGDIGGLSPATSGEFDPEGSLQRNVPKSRSMLHVSTPYCAPPTENPALQRAF